MSPGETQTPTVGVALPSETTPELSRVPVRSHSDDASVDATVCGRRDRVRIGTVLLRV